MIVPKLRFSEFKDEWNEKLLSDFTTFSKGKGLSKSDIVKNGKNPCIRYGELYTTYGSTISEAISYTNLDKNNCVLIELTHYLKTKKRDSPTRVLDSNETNHQRLASILERLQR